MKISATILIVLFSSSPFEYVKTIHSNSKYLLSRVLLSINVVDVYRKILKDVKGLLKESEVLVGYFRKSSWPSISLQTKMICCEFTWQLSFHGSKVHSYKKSFNNFAHCLTYIYLLVCGFSIYREALLWYLSFEDYLLLFGEFLISPGLWLP